MSIGGDRWIPTLPGFEISSPARVLDPSTKVSSLIDSDLSFWNMEILRENFGTHDVNHISNISLSINTPEDKLI